MKRSLAGSAFLSALLLLAACSSKDDGPDDDDGGDPQTQSRPGMGSSKEQPVGTPYTLPSGVELKKPIKGYDPYCIKPEQKEQDKKGHGGLVRLCLNFRNNTQQPINVVFPPGLLFVADSEESQNGMVIQVTTIEVPAGRTEFFAPLYLFCINKDRDPTLGAEDSYGLGPVTQDSSILELTGLLQNKTLPLEDLDYTVQNAVWSITEGSGLTSDDRAAIDKL